MPADVCEVVTQITRDYEKAKSSMTANARERCNPIRVVNEIGAFSLKSPGEGEINRLRDLIERVAYGSSDGYRFPSVRQDVPKTFPLAIATLEAVRRGANVAGLARDQTEIVRRLAERGSRQGRPFIEFSDALDLFYDLWPTDEESTSVDSSIWAAFGKRVFGKTDSEAASEKAELGQAFLRAIELHEARGAILLTHIDGGEQHEHAFDAAANIVIHVNPAWFADLVRRVVDVRLLEPENQGKVLDALQAYTAVEDSLHLSDQHMRFFQAGEVSTNYLKFLWLRDMELGPASIKAPPLRLSDDDIRAMVESLLHTRFMFRVRDRDGAALPDRFVVSSCLPDHIGSAVGGAMDPEDMDELEKGGADFTAQLLTVEEMLGLPMGGAIFSTQLKIVGARAVPPGLVPRLLAWCGRGNARIKACWKQGVCFAFKNEYLVLLYECRGATGAGFIECHAMGSATDEKAGGILREVIEELHQLLRNDKYGFPGVGLCKTQMIKKRTACTDGELEALLRRHEEALKDHMNVKFEELARKSDAIAGGLCRRSEENALFLRHVDASNSSHS